MSEIKPGDYVKISGQDSIGEVISVKGNDLQVALGIMKVNVKKNKVTLAQAPVIQQDFNSQPKDFAMSAGIDTREKLMHFKFELDVKGKSKEEVMMELPVWVDEAVILGIKEAKVVHGRGNGILKDTVRSFLRKYKEVQSVGDDERGGDFVTVVKFRE
jgi:DNA mismatch repair protein MutS2